ncbi:holin protein of PBSX prophage [Halalkalibacter wakoensis JCM 9140]|uniref:Holin protein of PBSX prophage n=1 Tax=Halalkalibacter wakoensis JCM 9140 TaxID=1236970 RepID=W4Q597_9BACI|nr:phage holin [Halalkalibacter wakoensis]GAE27120.1 holin protein of PBSX prophage [Halalkalibacter wakoensis JCM 9140]
MMFDTASITRFFGLIVALLTYFGINVPEDIVEGLVSLVVAVLAVYAAWKDNDITKKAVENKKLLKELEESEK